MIYYDITENNTRLGQSVTDVGVGVVGLESITGADILISPLKKPLPRKVNTPPGSTKLDEHLSCGMLIQRKSVADLLTSIPDLGHILQRMQFKGSICWLLANGTFTRSADGYVIVNGRQTGWKWAAYRGALDAWQFRGGLLHEEPTDALGDEWILNWDKKLPALHETHDRILEPRAMGGLTGGAFHPRPWEATLATLPGCGAVRAETIGKHTGSLAYALWWITDPDAQPLPGIGPKLREQWRAYLGLEQSQIVMPMTRININTGDNRTFTDYQPITKPLPSDFAEINDLLEGLPF